MLSRDLIEHLRLIQLHQRLMDRRQRRGNALASAAGGPTEERTEGIYSATYYAPTQYRTPA